MRSYLLLKYTFLIFIQFMLYVGKREVLYVSTYHKFPVGWILVVKVYIGQISVSNFTLRHLCKSLCIVFLLVFAFSQDSTCTAVQGI